LATSGKRWLRTSRRHPTTPLRRRYVAVRIAFDVHRDAGNHLRGSTVPISIINGIRIYSEWHGEDKNSRPLVANQMVAC
jgi:hypothetical protein